MLNKTKKYSTLSTEAFKELHKFQKQTTKLLKTGVPHIDKHLGGLLPSDLVVLASGSGVGKTYTYQKIVNNFLDTEINPNASNYVTLEFQLEMKTLSIVLREIHEVLDKNKQDILTKPFTEEEKKEVALFYEQTLDDRRNIVEESVNTEEFFEICQEFCSLHKDKEAVIIGIDHLLLILPSGRGEDPLATIATYTNILRKKFKNVYFLYLSQLNRMNYSNIQEKSNLMVPSVAHIYGSSHFEFLSSYVIALTDPFRLGVAQYMKVQEHRYPYLSEHLTAPDDKGYCSFETLGKVFYHLLKVRDSDYPYDNMWVETKNLPEEQIEKLKMDLESTKPSAPTIQDISFDIPDFVMTAKDAFGD